MKIKEYLNSLISRRKNNASSKSTKPKSHHESISSTDCHYDICGYENTNKIPLNDHHSRTQILLTRHAQLVNTIVRIRSQDNLCSSCPHCRILHQSEQKNLCLNRNYSSTLATCNPHRECQHQTFINSLTTKTRQRSKIRTNPWIKTTHILQPEYNSKLSSGLIHSESFPQTISNGNIHPSNIILHQSDSGHGFSLSSSRINDSSSPDNTSNDGPLLDEKQNHLKQYFPSKTKQKIKKPLNQSYFQHPKKSSIDDTYHSSRLYNDHFSIEFEKIVENERLYKQRSLTQKCPFILPLDETDIQLSYSSTTLKKINSRTILKHIEEIENEILMIKNLNLNHDNSSNIYSKQDKRQSIHEQVDQWVEQCLTTTKNQPTNHLLHTECNHLSNTIKDYVQCVYSNDNHQTSSLPKSQKKPELMTAFYISSIPTIKRTFSFIDQSLQLSKFQTKSNIFKPIHECPF